MNFRNIMTGSWLIECFCRILMKSAHKDHLRAMLEEVQRQVRIHRFPNDQGDNVKTQCPETNNRGFTKLLYFNPGLYKDSSGRVVKVQETDNNNEIPDLIRLSVNISEVNQAASNAKKIDRKNRICNVGDNK